MYFKIKNKKKTKDHKLKYKTTVKIITIVELTVSTPESSKSSIGCDQSELQFNGVAEVIN